MFQRTMSSKCERLFPMFHIIAHGFTFVSFLSSRFFTSEGALVVCTTMGQLLLIDIETFQVVQGMWVS